MSYANLKAHPDAVRYVGTPCVECGATIEGGYTSKAHADRCFMCDFWQCYVDGVHPSGLESVNVARVVRYHGRHYYIEPDIEGRSGMKAFGGKLFVVHFTDGRVVETRNLWHQGTIPPRFRDRLPDNTLRIEGMSL